MATYTWAVISQRQEQDCRRGDRDSIHIRNDGGNGREPRRIFLRRCSHSFGSSPKRRFPNFAIFFYVFVSEDPIKSSVVSVGSERSIISISCQQSPKRSLFYNSNSITG